VADTVTGTVALAGLERRALWARRGADQDRAPVTPQKRLVIEHVRTWALGSGFEVRQDAAGNLVVRVPARAGRGSASTIILRGIPTVERFMRLLAGVVDELSAPWRPRRGKASNQGRLARGYARRPKAS